MAQKVEVLLVDDIDGGEADETVSFSIDGTSYEIDLSKKNAAKLRDDYNLPGWNGAGYLVALVVVTHDETLLRVPAEAGVRTSVLRLEAGRLTRDAEHEPLLSTSLSH